MRVENGEEASRSTRQGNAEWLRGARVVGVLGLFYRPEGRMGEPEAVEFLLSDSQSLLLTCASDWTLHIGPGTWPRLPDWCVPAGQWEFAALPHLPEPPDGGWTVTADDAPRVWRCRPKWGGDRSGGKVGNRQDHGLLAGRADLRVHNGRNRRHPT